MYFHHFTTLHAEHTLLWSLGGAGVRFERISLRSLHGPALKGRSEKSHPDVERLVRAVQRGPSKRDRQWAFKHCDFSGCSVWQQQIWKYLADHVAAGHVISYGMLAEKLGRPGAARSVGSTMAKNRFPVLIPCHRVVASGGKLGGFMNGEADGLRLKRHMLAQEQVYYIGNTLKNDEALL